MDAGRRLELTVGTMLIVALAGTAAFLVGMKLSTRYLPPPIDNPYSEIEKAIHSLRLVPDGLAEVPQCTGTARQPSEAFSALLEQAKEGNRQAQYVLAVSYITGEDTPCNFPSAVVWLSRAADAKFAPAQYMLGRLDEARGFDGEMDAANWYKKAAEAGHMRAMHRYGSLCLMGMGTPRNIDEAWFWYEAAGRVGQKDSLFNLGVMYQTGEPFLEEASLEEAYFWFSVAAQMGDASALNYKVQLEDQLEEDVVAAQTTRARAWRPEEAAPIANGAFSLKPRDYLPHNDDIVEPAEDASDDDEEDSEIDENEGSEDESTDADAEV